MPKTSFTVEPVSREDAPARFLDLFYPFHYKVGFAVEGAMRGRALSQQQTIILWIIRSEGEDGLRMRRKDIEQRLMGWFDITSSTLSKALRAMARPDMGLVTITEHPESAREKSIELTPRGQDHIGTMIASGTEFITRVANQLTDEEIQAGMLFLTRVSDVVANMIEEKDA